MNEKKPNFYEIWQRNRRQLNRVDDGPSWYWIFFGALMGLVASLWLTRLSDRLGVGAASASLPTPGQG
ncbi:hypothetical protein HYR54_00525 [Candidatus Acetothermia bacterium]|nr:hypothetical protein [Candidatus Acetothermia bacterium]